MAASSGSPVRATAASAPGSGTPGRFPAHTNWGVSRSMNSRRGYRSRNVRAAGSFHRATRSRRVSARRRAGGLRGTQTAIRASALCTAGRSRHRDRRASLGAAQGNRPRQSPLTKATAPLGQAARLLSREAVAQRVGRGQASHRWIVRQQRMRHRAWIIASSEFVSHPVHLEGVYATDSRERSRESPARPAARATLALILFAMGRPPPRFDCRTDS